ncbi:MAG: glycosyltransferase family 4 protein [Acidobacteria bacterium]|nr:glycosyltransferase family 4 protein [Acidobacteriota bacterium]
MSDAKLKALLLANVPTPYNLPPMKIIGDHKGWSFTACFISTSNEAVGWTEPDAGLEPSSGTFVLDQRWPWLRRLFGSHAAATVALLERLARARPDYLILYGYTQAPQALALLWALIRAAPFAVVGDANIHADCASGLRQRAKRLWLRQVTRRASALITVGMANRMFWESYGARPDQLFDLRYPVDNDYFAREAAAQSAAAAELREGWGLTGKVIFLYVGRLIERKGVDLLIRAARSLPDEAIGVVIVGEGDARAALERLAAGDNRIVFAGRAGYHEAPRYYSLADVLVLPARHEPWGLVVNEAMACGLAVIAHRHCGAAVDLVSADNGVALETFSVEELSDSMRLFAHDPARLRSMQSRSREKIKDWSIDAAAAGIIHAVESSAKLNIRSGEILR